MRSWQNNRELKIRVAAGYNGVRGTLPKNMMKDKMRYIYIFTLCTLLSCSETNTPISIDENPEIIFLKGKFYGAIDFH